MQQDCISLTRSRLVSGPPSVAVFGWFKPPHDAPLFCHSHTKSRRRKGKKGGGERSLASIIDSLQCVGEWECVVYHEERIAAAATTHQRKN
ncbi:unnamed protein product [Boreogadus saida]